MQTTLDMSPDPAQPRLDVDGIYPHSVLRADRGPWQDRKRAWGDLDFNSRAGREGVSTWETESNFAKQHLAAISDGLSTFDPVLAEINYEWYAPPEAKILDAFAGGSVRGLVAGNGGYHYTGIDLSARQVEANKAQADDWERRDLIGGSVEWITGDSAEVLPALPSETFDYVMTCPPYHDLEVYSDAPEDLSKMAWDDFADAYLHIIAESVRCLANDRFSTWVVGEVRAPNGAIRGLVPLTIEAHARAGAKLHNDAILQNVLGTVPVRLGRQWRATRKMGRHHQYVLTFVKGNPKRATQNLAVAP